MNALWESRRFKRFAIECRSKPEEIYFRIGSREKEAEFLKTYDFGAVLPDDCVVISTYFDSDRGLMIFTVWSSEFDAIPICCPSVIIIAKQAQ